MTRIPNKYDVKWIIILFLLICPVASGATVKPLRAVVLVSKNIKPYLQAVEGFTQGINEKSASDIEVFHLEKYKGKGLEILKETLNGKNVDIYLAVGPEALRFFTEESVVNRNKIIYTMILNPEQIIPYSEEICGVPLSIPVEIQIDYIRDNFPGIHRLGLLHDPRYNGLFYERANKYGILFDLRIIPLAVTSKKDIPGVLKTHWDNIDGLWLVPDQTVISESIVQYIIKESLFKGVPVFGYNRFFFESGAALAFIFDYEKLGAQTASLVYRKRSGGSCFRVAPSFEVWMNPKVIEKLNIDAAPHGASGDMGPP